MFFHITFVLTPDIHIPLEMSFSVYFGGSNTCIWMSRIRGIWKHFKSTFGLSPTCQLVKL